MDEPLMRKINGKLFLLLLIGTFVATGSVFAIHQFQYQRIGKALLWQARRADEQGQPRRAAQYLQRYLEFNPGDTAEKATLAKTWTSDAYPPASRPRFEAVKLLDEVLRVDPDVGLRRLLVKTAIEVRDFKMAKDHLVKLMPWKDVEEEIARDRLARKSKKPQPDAPSRENCDRGELECYWGQVLEADKQPEDAISCYRLTIRHAPEMQTGYIRLAHLLRRKNETDPLTKQQNQLEADQAIEQLVVRNTESYESYLARWRYRREFDLLKIRENADKGKIELDGTRGAAEDVAQAVKRMPESIDVLLAAADLERLRGRVAAEASDKTVEQRRQGMKEHRSRAMEYLSRGLELVAKVKAGTIEDAEFQLLWHKGNLILDDLDLERMQREQDGVADIDNPSLRTEVITVIDRVRKSQMPAAADYMEGRLFVHERRWSEAAQRFERARAQLAPQPDLACQANLYLGQCYDRLEEHTQMFNAYKRVVDWDPSSVPALMGMAAARWAQGQLENSLAQYEVVMKQRKVPPRGWIDIARLEIQRQAQTASPDWTRADACLANAVDYFPEGNLELNLLRAEVLIRKGQPDEARTVLIAARDKDPKEAEYWTALVDLALRQKKIDEAENLLAQARKKTEDKVSLRLVEARLVSARDGKKSASKIMDLASKREHLNERDQARLLNGLAEVLFRIEDVKDARNLWTEMSALPRQKNELRLQLLLFDLAMREGDVAGMQKTLDDIQQIEHGAGSYHRYGQGLYLIWQARRAASHEERDELLRKARQHVEAVLTQRPSWPPVFLARGEIAELKGNHEQAAKDMQEAIKNGENSPSVIRKLVGLLTQLGKDNEAQFLLARLQQSALKGSDLGRLAVTVAVRRGEMGQALEMARRAVREDSNNPEDLVWMARVLATAKQYDEAEQKLQEAIARPGAPLPAWVLLIQLHVNRNKKDQALAVLKKMKATLPADQLPLALGRAYDALGQRKAAMAEYKKVVEAKPEISVLREVISAHLGAARTSEAEPLLRMVARGEVKSAAIGDIDWARRTLALQISGGTDYQRFSEALELVGLKLDDTGKLRPDPKVEENTENLRARARVLATQNQKQFRDRAMEIFRDLDAKKSLTPEDEFVLAVLHEAQGDIRRSQERLESLVQPRTRTPQFVAQYAVSLINHRRQENSLEKAAEAVGWLEEMEKRAGGINSFASIEIRGRLLEAQGKGEEAVNLIRVHVNREGAKPEEVLLLLGTLGRQKRYQEAFDLCEKTWQEGKCMPEAVGSISVGLLRVLKPTDARVAALEKHLEEAIKKKPESVVLMMHLADLHDQRGKYDRSAEMYRKILKKEPNNIVALNNLAWLLAHRTGAAEEALEYINSALRGMGRRPDLLDTRGLVHLALKDTGRALADLQEATKDSPTANRLYHLARAHHEDRNQSKARELLREAKSRGLQLSSLHPVEQESAKKLLQEYGFR